MPPARSRIPAAKHSIAYATVASVKLKCGPCSKLRYNRRKNSKEDSGRKHCKPIYSVDLRMISQGWPNHSRQLVAICFLLFVKPSFQYFYTLLFLGRLLTESNDQEQLPKPHLNQNSQLYGQQNSSTVHPTLISRQWSKRQMRFSWVDTSCLNNWKSKLIYRKNAKYFAMGH